MKESIRIRDQDDNRCNNKAHRRIQHYLISQIARCQQQRRRIQDDWCVCLHLYAPIVVLFVLFLLLRQAQY